MNAVEWKCHAWKIVLSVAVALSSGLLIFSVVLDLPTVPISTAFGGAAPSQPIARPDCASLAPQGESWHGVDLDLDREERAVSVHVGSARLTVEPASQFDADLADHEVQWHSDLGIDAVVVQNSAQSRVHRFDSETFAAAHRPLGDQPIDKLTLCYDLELTVNADANPSLTRTFEWSIDESVTPARWQLESGTSGVSTYEVSVTKGTGVERDWQVNGTITVDNLTPADVELESVDAIVEGGMDAQVDCGVEVDGYSLASGASLTCDYHSELPGPSTRTANIQVNTRGRVRGASATSHIDFDRANVHEIGRSVFVTDNQGRAWTFHESGSTKYERTFECDADAGLHPSAVRIGGTDQRSSTSVSVDCQADRAQPTAARPGER